MWIVSLLILTCIDTGPESTLSSRLSHMGTVASTFVDFQVFFGSLTHLAFAEVSYCCLQGGLTTFSAIHP
jgi:hypothetical protein